MPRTPLGPFAVALALAVTAAVLLAGPAAAAMSPSATGSTATSTGATTSEQRIEVPGGPDTAGPVSLDTTLFVPATTPAPAVLVAHGFGGSKASVDADALDLVERGFVVLTWSARGFGASTGQITLNSPDHEVADARALVDWLAARPEVIRDAPGDPRVGVTGGSYGGAVSLLLAGYDQRVDALAPVITWNDLGQALFPNAATPQAPPLDSPARGAFAPDGVFKRGWAGVFFSAGLNPTGPADGRAGPAGDPGAPTGGTAGLPATGTSGTATAGAAGAPPAADGSSPATADGSSADPPTGGAPAAADGSADPATGGPPVPARDPTMPRTCGRFTAAVCAAYTEAATTTRQSPATAALLRRSSPLSVNDRITAPTLLVQGEQDTLFGLDQADANAHQIAATGTPVKVVWFAGGHDGAAPLQPVRDVIGDWFAFHLARSGADPGTGFSYAVESGVRTSGSTPTGRTVVAPGYPGLAGAPPLTTELLGLDGMAQTVLNPAGGSPAAITSLPGIGGALGSLGGRISALSAELPGQSARFGTAPVPAPLLVAGAPRVELAVSRIAGQPAPAEAILFARTFEVTPDGLRTLLGSAAAPIRVAVPADGTPVTVTVTLPGVVAPIEAGNRLVVSIATTDQGYAGGADPAVWRVSATGPLTVPQVPGEAVTVATVPLGPAIGIGVVLGLALLAAVAARLVRRRNTAPPPEGGAPPLRIHDLAKTYRGGLSAVKGVSFTVQRGMVLGLLGPNGAGKTTVLRMLMGLIRPTAGGIVAFGEPIGPGAPVLARIGAFVEGPGFLPHLSGADNLRLYWAATGRPTAEARMDEALEIAGLGASIQRRVGTYSQGMRQRLAIAQAMLGLPELLVLDEPTNGLDPPQIHAMREVLRRYAAGGRTVLVSSHLLAEVEQTCTHVVVMHHGKVVADGTVEDIIAGGGAATFAVDAPARAAAVLGGLAGVRAVEVEGGSVHAELNGTPRASAVRALVTAGVDVAAAGPRRRLEDAFLQLVGEDTAP